MINSFSQALVSTPSTTLDIACCIFSKLKSSIWTDSWNYANILLQNMLDRSAELVLLSLQTRFSTANRVFKLLVIQCIADWIGEKQRNSILYSMRKSRWNISRRTYLGNCFYQSSGKQSLKWNEGPLMYSVRSDKDTPQLFTEGNVFNFLVSPPPATPNGKLS